MAVLSEYEEEEEEKVPPSAPSPPPVKLAQGAESESSAVTTSQESPPAPSSDNNLFQHDPVLSTLLEEHKRLPLELLTTVIDFLFRETDLSHEDRVESRVTEIVTAAKRRRTAYEGEDVAPEKVAKIEENKNLKPVMLSSKIVEVKPKSSRPEKPVTVKKADSDEAEPDEGKGLKPNLGNGFDHEKYSWTQTLGDVSLHIPMPEGTRGKSIACEIKSKTLLAGLKGQEPILKGEFYNTVQANDCFWSLEDDGTLTISLTKSNRMEWWKCVLKGEPEINTQKVEPEASKLTDLDTETRGTVEKMMTFLRVTDFRRNLLLWYISGRMQGFTRCAVQYDQRQKQLGLPTSDEAGKSEVLKKFMSQHPEMDFSKVTIS